MGIPADDSLANVDKPELGARRYYGLDRLRGLLAMAVVLYHYTLWLDLNHKLPTAIEKPLAILGIYAVGTFYTLSGAALAIVYGNREVDSRFIWTFWIKRLFRIVPLFWFATTATIVANGFKPVISETGRVLLSYTLLFSWWDPSAYFAVGAWSIGNEVAFYSLLPFILLGWRQRVSRVLIVVLATGAAAYYAFCIFDPLRSVADQWNAYIQPLNQLALFVAGIAVGRQLASQTNHRYGLFSLCIASTAFVAVATAIPQRTCIYGWARIGLMIICATWCYGAGGSWRRKEGSLGAVLDWLGKVSYSIYLIHPLVYGVVGRIGKTIFGERILEGRLSGEVERLAVLVISITGTLVAAGLSFRYIESPMIRRGKAVAERFRPQRMAAG